MFVNTYTKEGAIEARRRLQGNIMGGERLKINFAR